MHFKDNLLELCQFLGRSVFAEYRGRYFAAQFVGNGHGLGGLN